MAKNGTFTHGSDDGVAAVLANLPDHYPMELNRWDMSKLIWALRVASEAGAGLAVGDWADQFLSSVAETVGVEWV